MRQEDLAGLVGFRVKIAREAAGLTQKRLGRLAKMDQANIVRLEKGRHLPNLRTLLRISKAVGRPLSFFVHEPAERRPATRKP